jgi:hypothetical protein
MAKYNNKKIVDTLNKVECKALRTNAKVLANTLRRAQSRKKQKENDVDYINKQIGRFSMLVESYSAKETAENYKAVNRVYRRRLKKHQESKLYWEEKLELYMVL